MILGTKNYQTEFFGWVEVLLKLFQQISIVNFRQIYREPADGGMIKHESCNGVFRISSELVQTSGSESELQIK